MTRYLLLFDSYNLVFVGRPLWQEDMSVLYIFCWPLPVQSFSGSSPLGFATTFYCLRFETSLFVTSYYSQGHGGIPSRLHMGSQQTQSQSHIATDSQSVSLGVEPHLGLMTRILILFDSYGLIFVGRPLLPEDGSVFCICCWSLPAQFFSGQSPLRLATIFYCLRCETYFSSPPTTCRVTTEVTDSASTRSTPLTDSGFPSIRINFHLLLAGVIL
jgi:hypothetical protein